MLANFYGYTGKFAPYERAVLEAARHVHADLHHESFRLSGLDITVHVPLGRAIALSFRGDRVGADESMNEMLRLAEAQRQVGVLVWALFWASFCCLVERDFERAQAFADRTFALSNEHGFGFWAAAGQASQGAASVIADPGRAVALIQNALAKLQGMPSWHPHYLCFEAEALLRLKQIADARVAVDRALTITANGGVTWWDAELHRIRAAVIRAEGGGDTAVRAALGRAVAIAEQQGSETFRRRAVADIGDA
jgi:predicted ATPase